MTPKDDSLNTREIEKILARIPPSHLREFGIRIELHPDPCPRCGGRQGVNQVQDVRPDLPAANCLDFDCYMIGRRDR